MIKANHTFWGGLFFRYYTEIRLRRHFRFICFEGDVKDNGLPILMIANHFSWWDGFIQLYTNERFFKRRFFVMMLEQQLKKHPILTYAGAFSIRKNARNVVESLDYALQVLTSNQQLLLLFPQGEIKSLYTSDIRFERGLEYLLSKRMNEIQLVFNVNLIDYFSDNKPGLTVYLKEFPLRDITSLERIEDEFNLFAAACKLKQRE